MVKGTARQVVVVKSPDKKLFEQAIFFLYEDALEKHGVGERELLDEARRIADGYVAPRTPKKARARLLPLLWTLLGGGLATAIWLLASLCL